MCKYAIFFLLLIGGVIMANELEDSAQLFIQAQVQKIDPIFKQMASTYWEATGTGKEELYGKYAELELQMRKIFSNKEDFAKLKDFYECKGIQDPLIQRQLELLYLSYLQNQMDPQLMEQMVKLASALEAKFNTHRALFEGQAVADNVLVGVLQSETKMDRRQAAWEASKTVGEAIAPDLIKLVKIRNQIAQQMGFENYYVMSLRFAEQNSVELAAVFDELATVTEKPFMALKKLIDAKLREKYGLAADATLYPYHYQDRFFQEVQDIGGVNMDEYLKDKDVKQIVENFYNGIGLPVTDMLKRSDLYERPGKYQHAYCIDMDREGDVRTMMSFRNDRYWMDTMLHELGHGVYYMYLDRSLPWLLREDAHTFVTEAIAQMFGGMTTNVHWLRQAVGIPEDVLKKWQPTLELEQKMSLLIFCQWSLVMVNFERELYRNPDQDLNKLWWDLVEKYQKVNRIPGRDKADWAAKIHFTSSPVYYHNYMLGNLLVSQMMHHVAEKILKEKDVSKVTFIGQPEVGKYFREQVFGLGKKLRWDYMVIESTGEPLTAKYFAKDVELKE